MHVSLGAERFHKLHRQIQGIGPARLPNKMLGPHPQNDFVQIPRRGGNPMAGNAQRCPARRLPSAVVAARSDHFAQPAQQRRAGVGDVGGHVVFDWEEVAFLVGDVDPGEAAILEGADGLLLVTEWNAYRSPDFERIRDLMKTKVVFDGRNIWERKFVESFGLSYYGIGV